MATEYFQIRDTVGTSWSLVRNFSAGERCPTLVCLHGFTGSGKDFEPLLAKLPENQFNSVCVDLPGHGNTIVEDRLQSFGLDNILGTIGDICSTLPVQGDVVIVGYSMGARIGLQYLARHPEVQGILISGSPGLKTLQEQSQRISEDARWIEKLNSMEYSIDDFCNDWESQPVISPQRSLPEPFASELTERRRNNRKHELANALQFMGTGTLSALWDELGALKNALLIVGENDLKFRQIADDMIQRNPLIKLKIIEGSGHSPHLEQPDRTAKTVAETIRGS